MSAPTKERLETLELLLGSQKAVADYFNVSTRTVRYWKTGDRTPTDYHDTRLDKAYAIRYVWHVARTDAQEKYLAKNLGVSQKTVKRWKTGGSLPNKSNNEAAQVYARSRGVSTFSRQLSVEGRQTEDRNAMYQAVVTITKNKTGRITTYEKDDRVTIKGKQFYGDAFFSGDEEGKDRSMAQAVSYLDTWMNYEGIDAREIDFHVSFVKRYNFLGE